MLDKPGEYVLAGLLSCQLYEFCANPSITITASHVHLNTAGGGIEAFGTAVQIVDGVSDVLIDGGGSLSGGGGLEVGKDDHVTVRDMNLGGDSDLCGGTAIYSTGAENLVVTDSSIGGADDIDGVVENGVFVRNFFGPNDTGSRGITISGKGNLIEHNAFDMGAGGIVAISVTDNNLIRNNLIADSSVGIYLAGKSNRVVGNEDAGGQSINQPGGTQYGIEIAPGAARNVVRGNLVIGNLYDLFDANGPPCTNVWRDNIYESSSGAVACIH
jgi:hypothetical protein